MISLFSHNLLSCPLFPTPQTYPKKRMANLLKKKITFFFWDALLQVWCVSTKALRKNIWGEKKKRERKINKSNRAPRSHLATLADGLVRRRG